MNKFLLNIMKSSLVLCSVVTMPQMLFAAKATEPNIEILVAVKFDGTAPFSEPNSIDDSNDGSHVPGEDERDNNNVVRTFDSVGYRVDYNVNELNATGVSITETLPANVTWVGIPPGCLPTSTLSNNDQTLTCELGDLAEGTSGTIFPTAAVGQLEDNDLLTVSFDINAAELTSPTSSAASSTTVSATAALTWVKSAPDLLENVDNAGILGTVFIYPISAQTTVGERGTEPVLIEQVDIDFEDHAYGMPTGTILATGLNLGGRSACGGYDGAGAFPFGTTVPAGSNMNNTTGGALAVPAEVFSCTLDGAKTTANNYAVFDINIADHDTTVLPTLNADGSPNDKDVGISAQIALWVSNADLQAAVADGGIENAITSPTTTQITRAANPLLDPPVGIELIPVNPDGPDTEVPEFSVLNNFSIVANGFAPNVPGTLVTRTISRFNPAPFVEREYTVTSASQDGDEPLDGVYREYDYRNPSVGGFDDRGFPEDPASNDSWSGLGVVARATPVTISFGTQYRSNESRERYANLCGEIDNQFLSVVDFPNFERLLVESRSPNAQTIGSVSNIAPTNGLAHIYIGGELEAWGRGDVARAVLINEGVNYVVEFAEAANPFRLSDAGNQSINQDELSCNQDDADADGWIDSLDTAAVNAKFDPDGDGIYENLNRVRVRVLDLRESMQVSQTFLRGASVTVHLSAVVKDTVATAPNDGKIYTHASMSHTEILWDPSVDNGPDLEETPDRCFGGNRSGGTLNGGSGWCGLQYDEAVEGLGLDNNGREQTTGSGASRFVQHDKITIVGAQLAIEKSNLDGLTDFVNNGDLVTFEIRPSVTGATIDTLQNVVVTDVLPAELELLSFTQPSFGNVCTQNAAGTTITCNFGNQSGGFSDSFQVTARVRETAEANDALANIARIEATDRPQIEVRAFAYMVSDAPQLMIRKEVPDLEGNCNNEPGLPGGAGGLVAGDCSLINTDNNLVYELVYENTGNVPLNNFQVIDVLPHGLDANEAQDPTFEGTPASVGDLGDGRTPESSFNGTTQLLSVLSTGSGTVEYTTNSAANVNRDPALDTSTYTGTIAGASAFRYTQTDSLAPGESVTLTVTISTAANQQDDIYTNTFGARANEIGLQARSNDVSIMVFEPVSIGSYVWLDSNGDGQQGLAATEPPVAGAQVALYRENLTTGVFEQVVVDIDGNAFPASSNGVLTTPASGLYEFENLPQGNYQVVVLPPAGFVPGPTQDPSDNADSTAAGSDDFSDSNLNTSGVLPASLPSGFTPTNSFVTGEFQLTPGSEPTELGAQVGDDQDNANAGDEQSGNMSVDIGLVRPVSIGSQVFVDADADGIQDNNALEGPIQGAVLTLYSVDSNGVRTQVTTDVNGNDVGDGGLGGAGTITTGADGNYLFDNLPLGDYEVRVDPPAGFVLPPLATQQTANDNSDVNDSNIVGEIGTTGVFFSPVFTLTSGGEPTEIGGFAGDSADDATETDGNLTVDFGFTQTLAIGSSVFRDNDNNGVQDAGDGGIANVLVQVFPVGADTSNPANAVGTDTTDVNGDYLVTGLLPGDYVVVIPTPPSEAPLSSADVASSAADNQTDGDDNGQQTASGQPVTSPIINLTVGAEPTQAGGANGQETDTGANTTGDNQDDAIDANGDMTIDFGFVPPLSLGSTVFLDNDNSGTQNGTEPGIGGVIVQLFLTGADPTNPANAIATDTTDANGDYLFTDLAPGDYFVYIPTPPSSAPLSSLGAAVDPDNNLDGDDNGTQGDDTAASSGQPVRTADITLAGNSEPTQAGGANGQEGDQGANTTGDDQDNINALIDADGNMTLDFGFTPPLSLGSSVFLDDDNDGVQEAGEPGIADIEVQLFPAGADPTLSTPLATVTTDANGDYLFTDIAPGDYFVYIPEPPADAPQSSGPTETDPDDNVDGNDNGIQTGIGDPVQSGVITLAGGTEPVNGTGNNDEQDTGDNTTGDDQDNINGLIDANGNMTLDFGFVRPLSVGSFIWNDANNDGLQDPSESGIVGATVTLLIDNGAGVFIPATDVAGNPIAAQTTGADGQYQFNGLLPGDYKVQVTPPLGFMPSDTQNGADEDASFVENDSNINLAASGSDNQAGSIPAGTYESGVITLTPGAEPNEVGGAVGDDLDGFGGGASDANGNMTIDFGFREQELGVIGNYIWVDENSDGLQDAGEPGIANVTVQLKDAGGNVIATTTTDANGGYLFTDLPPGDYFVDVDETTIPAGMTQSTLFTNAVDGSDADIVLDDGDFGNKDHSADGYAITLDEGEQNLTADFGYNYNPSADVNGNMNTGALGDRIWIDVDGDGVQDPGEAPVSGVELTLFTDPDGDGVFDTAVGTTITDSNGNYLFDGLAPNAYVVAVTDDAGASHPILDSAQFAQTGDPDHFMADQSTADTGEAGDNRSTSPVVLAPGDVFLNLDFGYQPNSSASVGSIGDTIWLDIDSDGSGPLVDSVDGTNNPTNAQGDDTGAADAAETGIAGVTVSLVADENGNGVADPGEPSIAATTTDANGQYLFAGLAYDDYVVVISDTENVLNGLEPTYDADGVLGSPNSSASTLDAANPDDRLQDFGFTPDAPLGSIGDTVWGDTDSSGDSQANQGAEPGLPNVTVNLYAVDENGDVIDANNDGVIDVNDAVATTVTDADGKYLFENLPLGDYVVEVDDATLPAAYADTATFITGGPLVDGEEAGPNSGDVSSVLSLTADQPYDHDQDFSYPPAPGAEGVIGDLIWGDLDGDGLGPDNGIDAADLAEPPLANVTVELLDSSGNVVAIQMTGPDGRYLFDGLDPTADFTVRVNSLTLPPAYQLSPSGDPENDGNNSSSVDLGQAGTDGTADPDGADNGVNLGQDFGYPVRANASNIGSIGDTIWFDQDSSGGDQATQGAEPGIAGVTVTLLDDVGNVVASTVTDSNGEYLFQGLEVSNTGVSYTVVVDEATLPDYVVASPTFAAGGVPDVTLTTAAPSDRDQDYSYPPVNADTPQAVIGNSIFLDNGSVPGVQDDADTPIGGVLVNLYEDSNGDGVIDPSVDEVIATAVTDDNGNYLFTGLDPDDTYGVEVDPSNFVVDGPLEGTSNGVDPDGGNDNISTVDLSAGDGNADEDGPNALNLGQDFGYVADTPVNVGNLIWLDVDADGSYEPNGTDGIAGTDDDETAIGDVTLDIYRDLNGNGVVDPGEPLYGTQTSSDTIDVTANGVDGNYAFSGLPADNYVIKVSDQNNVLEGYWHSEGTANTNNQSQSDSYAVDATTGDNLTADFGYYVEPGSIGNVIWEDLNGDGVYDPATEPGIDGITVTLTLTYPDGTITELNTVTEFGGMYQFDNLLIDEDFNGIASLGFGAGGDEPSHVVTLDQTTTPTNLDAIFDNFPVSTDTTDVGGNASDDDAQDVGGDDGVNGEPAFPPMGGLDATNDFGFAETASIGNRVWFDLDMDGVQDANEDGIANVIVNLLDDTGSIIATTTTGPNGEYIFNDLEPGTSYQTMVVASSLPANLVQTFDEGPNGGIGALDNTSDPITLSPGEDHLTADFGYGTPAGTGAIGDRVWVDTDADGVQDSNEIGLANVIVTLTPSPAVDLGSGPGVAITTVTDSNGNYLFTGLPVNATYIVEVDRATVPAEYVDVPNGLGDPDVRDGNSTDPDDQTTVVLTDANPVNLDSDFGYLPNDPSVLNAIGGTLWNDADEDANGPTGAGDQSDGVEPTYSGVTITLFNSSGDAVATTVTGADGSYLFEGLPDDTYQIVVTDSNNVLGGLSETADFDGINTPGVSSVSVSGGQTNLEQDFGYVDATPSVGSGDGSIGNTIFFDADNSGSADAGEGIEGVTVQLFGPGPDGIIGNGDDVLVDSTTTDGSGNYLFTSLDTSDTGPDPGTDYQVVVVPSSLPNGGTGWVNSVDPDTVNPGDNESVTTLTATTPVDLDQDFGYISDDMNSLSGTIWPDTDGDGELAESGRFGGVTVELRDSDGNVIQTTTTDINGDFMFENLPDGIYTVVVTDNDNVLNGFEHTDSPNGASDAGDSTSKDDTGYTVDLDSAGASSTPVSNATSDFGYMPIITNPISLGSFSATSSGEGQVLIEWTTQTEVANLGFRLYGRVGDEWALLNADLILGQGDSVSTQRYDMSVLTEATVFAIADIDFSGTETLHGPFQLGKPYGGVTKAKVIDWAAEKAARNQKALKRSTKRKQQQEVRMLRRAQKQVSQ